MKVKFQDHFDPAYECIHLLTRHFAPPEGLHSTQDVVNLFAEKSGVPLSELTPLTDPVQHAEDYILQNLDIPEETLRFYFDSSLGNWVTLGSALYEIQLSGIHFAQLLNQQRLPALHDLLSRILDCPIESLKTVDSLPELLRFLRNYPRIEHYKYACIQVFSDPEACQAEFSQIIEQATALFQKVEAPFLHLIDKAKHLFHSNQHPAFQDMMAHVPQNGELIFIPTLMPLDDIVLNDHNKSPSYLYYGVFFDAFDALVKKYCQDINRFSRGLKVLSDTRRLNILLELKDQPLYGQDISDRLNLSPATVSYHMANLLYENFVVAEKQGIYTQYSICRPNLQAFFQSLQNSLL